jgi:hypothetical protein
MKYLVDSDWLIDAATGRPEAQRIPDNFSEDGLAVSFSAVAEVYEGAFGTPHPQAVPFRAPVRVAVLPGQLIPPNR